MQRSVLAAGEALAAPAIELGMAPTAPVDQAKTALAARPPGSGGARCSANPPGAVLAALAQARAARSPRRARTGSRSRRPQVGAAEHNRSNPMTASIRIAVLAALLAASSSFAAPLTSSSAAPIPLRAGAQTSGEVRRTTWPSGTPREEYEIALGPDGAEVESGAYRMWSESGALLAEGRFENGLKSGEWVLNHANGALAARGKYRDGLRNQLWEFFHEDGSKSARGKYVLGLRDGNWTAWTPAGVEDPARGGDFEARTGEYSKDKPRFRGELRGGIPHGQWQTQWQSGSLQSRGELKDGLREGPWIICHYEGTPDRELLSGHYAAGEWQAPLGEDELSALLDDGMRRSPPVAGAPRLERLLALAAPRLNAARERELGQALDALAAADEGALEAARAATIAAGPSGVPLLVNALRVRLLEAPELERAARFDAALGALWGAGRVPGLAPVSEFTLEEGRMRALRWYTLWKLAGDESWFWDVDLRAHARAGAGPARWARALWRYVDEPWAELARQLPERARAVWGTRLALDGSGRGAADAKAERALADALQWLVDVQMPEGHWDSDRWSAADASPLSPADRGSGAAFQDVGVTGLALLALGAAGNTPRAGLHRDAYARGLAWLHARQDPQSGCFTTRESHDFLYGHAVALQAAAEAFAFAPDESLRASLQKAVDCALAARNPGAGWRYALPPDGQSDTSATFWMVCALNAARTAGLQVADQAFEDAMSWVDSMTEPKLGRVGYDVRGSWSSRIADVNAKAFKFTLGEALTGAALYMRSVCGQVSAKKEKDPLSTKQADLLARKLPKWDVASGVNDSCHWLFGTLALRQLGGKQWDAWRAALHKSLLPEQQREGAAAGSWEPHDAWACIGGRTYTTSMIALALSAEAREEPWTPRK
jgi:hypothetical protein